MGSEMSVHRDVFNVFAFGVVDYLIACLWSFKDYPDLTTLSLWRALTRYADDGSIEIDNNPTERELRAAALGRKNYLFAGSDSGGARAAAFYRLIGTAKLNGMDSEASLRYVLGRIADHPINRIGELLPWSVESYLAEAIDLAA